MLQQIFEDMYIHPDLLACLNADQKRILFSKMREEQVRKWKVWQDNEDQQNKKPRLPPKPGRKRVKFILDDFGEPLTTIIPSFEYDEDSSSPEIQEVELFNNMDHIDNSQESNANSLNTNDCRDLNIDKLQMIDKNEDEDDEVQSVLERSELYIQQKQEKDEKEKQSWLLKKQEQLKARQEKLQKIKDGLELINTIPVTEKPSIFNKEIKRIDSNNFRDRNKDKLNFNGIVSEKAKMYKQLEENTNNVLMNSRRLHHTLPVSRTKNRPEKPPSRSAVIEWYKTVEKCKGTGIDPTTNNVAQWFHGLIGRSESEELLKNQAVGTFLVRVSLRIWGFVISYRDSDRFKHFLVHAANDHYQLFGDSNVHHTSLIDLLEYHRINPISKLGNEYLLSSCPQPEFRPSYWELFD